ncbi:MAG: hypothetical protein R3A80_11485 [Bdellovibrionota bacterium]
MNKYILVFTFLFSIVNFSSTLQATELDLEMSGPEYTKYFDTAEFKSRPDRASAAVNNVIDLGKRNLDWFKLINSQRPADQQLPLYTPELQSGIPVESPKAYNEQTVLADYDALIEAMPESYKEVLLGTEELPVDHPFASNDEEYLLWARKMDRVYQSASRWKIMQPNLSYLAARSPQDIRGYYFLSQIEDLSAQLLAWADLEAGTQSQYVEWLVLLCHNSYEQKDACRAELNDSIATNTVLSFYEKYFPQAEKTYNSFFAIRNARSDAVWTSVNPLLTLFPFIKPESLEVEKWLVDNIEDEWQWGDWKLKLNFLDENTGNAQQTTHIVFTPGATPHVDGLGGSTITMDANAPLQDYGSRWTIRHEYGHVLGLPDCYIEFYDTDREIIINYQIDLDNLMCSRRGKLQEKHYLELKKHYYSQN